MLSSLEMAECVCEISVGDEFSSFRELDEKVKVFSARSFTQLWMRDARTLVAARKRTPNRVKAVNPELLYYNVKYCCVHGGRNFKSSGHGRRQTSYVHTFCFMFIKVIGAGGVVHHPTVLRSIYPYP